MFDEKTEILLSRIPATIESLLDCNIDKTNIEKLLQELKESQKHCKNLLNHIKDVKRQIKPKYQGVVVSINLADSFPYLTRISSFDPLKGKEGLYSCVPIQLNDEEVESLFKNEQLGNVGTIDVNNLFETDQLFEIPINLEDVQNHSDSFKLRERVKALFPGTSMFRDGHIVTVPGRRRRSSSSSSYEFSIKFSNDSFPSRTVHSSFILKGSSS